MNLREMFGAAEWVGYNYVTDRSGYILRGHFGVSEPKRATLRVIGLGAFLCYVNGRAVSDELLLPLSTDYEPRDNYPAGEVITDHCIYVPEYDITPLLVSGENVIAIHFGGGWYASCGDDRYGDPKAIWRVFGEGADGEFDFGSSTDDRIAKSYVTDACFTFKKTIEAHDYRALAQSATNAEHGDSEWERCVSAGALDTEYLFSDCPRDKVIKTLSPTAVFDGDGYTVYDAGENTTGYPVLTLNGATGERVSIRFSEVLTERGDIDPEFAQGQVLEYISDGTCRTVRPHFSWYGFRYFSISGAATVECVEVVHADVSVCSSFRSDNELLNWIHDTFINTQLTNMHNGIPSDCPHIEKRGYTGDGQLACHAVMNIFDAQSFYRKWIKDIADCQDKLSGHVQYTAPYIKAGGGPGGWGSAIVEVPYQFYKHYGDESLLREYYPRMLKYFEYLEAHSCAGLVVSDKEGEWCLGEWCTPTTNSIPVPYVNNYFYIKALKRCIEIARVIGKEEDVPILEGRVAERMFMMRAAYYNKYDGSFIGGVQGANAFAADLGVGDERTYTGMVARYEKLGGYDTGIFATDVLTRVLFERGNAQLAFDLLTSRNLHSYNTMKEMGGTTIFEYWPGSMRDRSRNHPMFGAVVAYFYDYLLGIRQTADSAAYRDMIISPALVDGIGRIEGYKQIPGGRVSVAYERMGDGVRFTVEIPAGHRARFVLGELERELDVGINVITL